MPDLTRLSAPEQQVLRLLAEGHTAKSIASELGTSVGAVNDRLREARRKTGVGSSRELARLLRAAQGDPQENRSEKIGMAPPPVPGNTDRRQPRPQIRWLKPIGAVALITLASGIGAFVALALGAGSATPARSPSPPHVLSTYPAANVRVAPGKLVLSVTFDRAMRSDSYSFVMRDPQTFPACDSKPAQSPDKRSFTLACVVEAQRTYEVGFNSLSHRNFVSADESAPAAPVLLRFSTR